jgi:prepilin-type N-terminal cleavage/methylation domain-containing protein
MTPVASLRKKLGFTMIEVLTALMVMSTLVRIGIPSYQEIRLKAEAAQVAGDFRVVRQAVYNHLAEDHRWPAEVGTGQVPLELVDDLPEGFTFQKGRYQLDWENLTLYSGLPNNPRVRTILGVSIVTQNRALGAALEEILGSNSAHFSLAGTYTFVLEIQ